MAEQRLPVVNADDGVWGGILREYLLKEHYNGDANVTAGTSTNGGHQFVTIRPGTSSAAPLTFAAGTNLSTPAAGSVEYDGTYYYLTTSSATRMQIVTNTAAQTLTQKTLTAPKIDVLADANGSNLLSLTTTASSANYLDIKNNIAGFSPTISAVGASSNIHINLIPKGVSGRITENGVEVTTISRVQTFTNKTLDNTNTVALKDTNFTLQDNGDATKQLQFDLASVTAGHTTTLVVPEVNGTTTIVGTDIAQNLSSKTINLANNTVTGTMAQFNTAVSDGDIDFQLVPTAIKTSNYTAAANELVLVDCGASNVIVSLPTSPADGTKVGISTVGLSSTGKTVTMRATGTAKFNLYIDGVFANWTDLPASIVTTVQYSTSSQRWTVLEYQQTQTSVAEATHAGSADTLTTSRTFQTNLASTSAVGFNGSANNVHGVTGTLPVANGGTGATTLASGNVLVGAGTGAVTAIKAAPSGAFVGTTDAQVLTNKTIIGVTGMLVPVQGHTSGHETYTIASGSLTQIAGTTINNNSFTPAVGDRIMVGTAPTSSGAGVPYNQTANPANGVYVVTSNTTNLSLARATDLSGSVNPAGLSVYSEYASASWLPQSLWTVTTPSSAATFTYGSGNIGFSSVGGQTIQPRSVYVGDGEIGFWNNTPGISTYLMSNPGAPASTDQNLTLPAPTTDTIVSRTSTDTLTNKWLQPRIITPTVASTYTINVTTTDQYNIINQNSNISSITTTGSPVDGQKIMVRIKSDGTARTVAWGSIFISSGVSALLSTTVASKTHHVAFVYDSTAAKFVCLACDVNGY